MPLDKPQWRVWVQEDYLNGELLCIQESHHSLCDGISLAYSMLQLGDTYDTSKMLQIPMPGWWVKWVIRAMMPYYLV